MTDMMPAWVRETYGPADGFRLEHVPMPVPRRGEVVLRVEATALSAGDVRLMLGDPLLVRPVFGLTRPKYPVRGMEVAGTVVAVGENAIGAELGERVVGELVGGGGLASHVVIPAARLVPIPPDVSSVTAATLPVSAGTAWQALDRAGIGIHSELRADRRRSAHAVPRVLVIGASGGVGTFAVQLAALRGAEVWATCGERNARLVEHLGAVRTLDHRRSPLSALPAGHFDAVIDIAGGIGLRELQRLVAPGGSVVLVTGDGGHVLGPIPRMLKAAILSVGSSRRIRPLAATPRPEILAKLLELTAEGRITSVIEHEYGFDQASAALAHLEAGHTVGKVVVRAALESRE
ncbi:NADPH:quinone reductase-like Zn-dependent oxidoreductase [Microbacterium phyllosphaerae]|uniref:NADPH:quinone reductase-like Zn-dependent oxidoreductase n=1 Tax=Microbacterium phyllosphaerae TaxID=124798 RepID=A0ABS4WLS5_9MICO|nr:NAD(P)-dependent alcohol dehydrogenase [Microbacterium phyllosphaerae]MBP2376509.1 NADPH:quinone reductase-like Zn-dependent oxidoreductase [Microbacterium phyllosphaerae]